MFGQVSACRPSSPSYGQDSVGPGSLPHVATPTDLRSTEGLGNVECRHRQGNKHKSGCQGRGRSKEYRVIDNIISTILREHI